MAKKKLMTRSEHNIEAQRLLGLANIKNSLPIPYQFEWDGVGPPTIYDADDNCVCTLSTGNLDKSYTTKQIISNAKRLLSGNID